MMFGALIIFFLVVEPEGLNRLVAEHPQLLPNLAIRVLRYARKRQLSCDFG